MKLKKCWKFVVMSSHFISFSDESFHPGVLLGFRYGDLSMKTLEETNCFASRDTHQKTQLNSLDSTPDSALMTLLAQSYLWLAVYTPACIYISTAGQTQSRYLLFLKAIFSSKSTKWHLHVTPPDMPLVQLWHHAVSNYDIIQSAQQWTHQAASCLRLDSLKLPSRQRCPH